MAPQSKGICHLEKSKPNIKQPLLVNTLSFAITQKIVDKHTKSNHLQNKMTLKKKTSNHQITPLHKLHRLLQN